MMRIARNPLAWAGAAAVLLCLLPWAAEALGETFYVGVVSRIMVFAIAASALNLVFGYGGLVSLGHALFLGLGAYSVAIPSVYGVDNGLVHVAICVASCAAAGAVIGAISLRTTGIAFIMITLAFAQMGYFAFVSLKQFGGDDGTPIALPSRFGGIDLGQRLHLYYAILAVLAVTIVAMARMRTSGFGMVLRGARQNARRSSALGFDVKRVQWLAYVLSAVVCGLAGLLSANLSAFASPAGMSWFVSSELIVMVVLGGVGTVAGPVIGAFAFIGVEEVAKQLTSHWAAYLGTAIILISVLARKGIVGALGVPAAGREPAHADPAEAAVKTLKVAS